jgi:hypothetical protein
MAAYSANTNRNTEKLFQAYTLLNVKPGDSADTIRQEYRKLARIYHPDKLSSNPPAMAEATEKMKAINEAYSLIKCAPLGENDTAPAETSHTRTADAHSPETGTTNKTGRFEKITHFIYGAIIGAGFSLIVLLIGMPLYKHLLSNTDRLETVIYATYISMGVTITVSGILAAMLKDRYYGFIGKLFTISSKKHAKKTRI